MWVSPPLQTANQETTLDKDTNKINASKRQKLKPFQEGENKYI